MCHFPQKVTVPEYGRVKLDPEGNVTIPCGKCDQCINKRAQEWALRCQHEISLHDNSSFITLTYNQQSLPSHLLTKTHFQKFMKLLRKQLYPKQIRYIVAHEYGTINFRPHHHVMIFGYNPPNQKLIGHGSKGDPLFSSPDIDRLWKHGFHSIGTANAKTAYYIAAYSLGGKTHTFPDPDGNLITVSDSMNCSKRPGIGFDYLMQNHLQLTDSKSHLPRFYKKKLEKHYPEIYQEYTNLQDSLTIGKTPISHQQNYAKYIINKQKSDAELEFRRAPDENPNFTQDTRLKNILDWNNEYLQDKK